MELGPQKTRLRELLARLDRVATVSRGHRAGLHLDDRKLVEQYLAILIAWEDQVQGLPRSDPDATVSLGPAPRPGTNAFRARRN